MLACWLSCLSLVIGNYAISIMSKEACSCVCTEKKQNVHLFISKSPQTALHLTPSSLSILQGIHCVLPLGLDCVRRLQRADIFPIIIFIGQSARSARKLRWNPLNKSHFLSVGKLCHSQSLGYFPPWSDEGNHVTWHHKRIMPVRELWQWTTVGLRILGHTHRLLSHVKSTLSVRLWLHVNILTWSSRCV